MKHFLIGAAALVFSITAQAQTPAPWSPTPTVPSALSYCWDTVALANIVCGAGHTGGAATTTPPAVTGLGTLALTNASTALSTMTADPNSAAWPTVPGMMLVINDATSAGTIYVCPLGGTCTVANGIPLLAGQSYGVYKPATAMTAIAASTATVKMQW